MKFYSLIMLPVASIASGLFSIMGAEINPYYYLLAFIWGFNAFMQAFFLINLHYYDLEDFSKN